MLNRIEKEKKQREDFDNVRFELVNDSGFRDEFEQQIKNSRISPDKSLMYTMSFLKTVNGCWSKKISETSALIHVTNDIREKAASRYRIDPSVELRAIFETKEDITISFSGDEAYDSEKTQFFKPAGAWIHFITDYINTCNGRNKGGYYICEVSGRKLRIEKGQYYIFVYETEYIGFYNDKLNEYVIVNSKNGEVVELPDGVEFDDLVLLMRNTKSHSVIDLDGYDDASISAQEELEERQYAHNNELESVNNIKIKSRIDALKHLSENRIRELETELFSATNPKEVEKIKRAIEKDQTKTEKKVSILSEKLKIASSYSLKAICILFVK